MDFIAKISADKGVSFDFTSNEKLKESGFAIEGRTVNGLVTKDGIQINVNSAKALNTVVGHEVMHIFEGTELYPEIQRIVKEVAVKKGEYQSRYDEITKLYEDIEDADIDKELTADLVGDYLFSDEDFIRRLSTENRSIFDKLRDEIKYLCKVATAGSKELKELEKAKKLFEKVYREAEEKINTADEGGVRYSVTSDNQGKYVKVDVNQNIFDGKNTREMQEIARKLIRDNYKGKVLPVGTEGKAYINKHSADEYAYPANRRMDENIKESKMRASTELDNLLSVSEFIENQPDDGRHPQATGGWDVYTTRFEVGNTMFAGEIKIMVTDRGYVFYDITQIKRLPVNGGQTKINSVAASGNLSVNSIPNSTENVKQKGDFSLSSKDTAPKKYGNYNVYGEDVMLEGEAKPTDKREFTAPTRESIAEGKKKVITDAPIRGDFNPLKNEQVESDETVEPVETTVIKTVEDRISAKIENSKEELSNNQRLLEEANADFDRRIAEAGAEYDAKKKGHFCADTEMSSVFRLLTFNLRCNLIKQRKA